jgi:heme/copper-type cytochrome/quinol oxidase subunit 2
MRKVVITLIIILIGLASSSVVSAYKGESLDSTNSRQALIAESAGEEDADDGGVTVPVEGSDWVKDLFGGDLKLRIMSPTNFMGMEGTASIWSIIAYVYSFITIILFLGFLFAIAIGAIKWISSQGQEGKVQSAQKWIRNAVMGFVAVIVVFIIVNFISYILGIGSIFEVGQNLAVCEGKVLYEYKEELRESTGKEPEKWDCVWRCPEGAEGWVCE